MRLEPFGAGEESTYTISVTNEGAEADMNVDVMVKLPRGMSYLEGVGDSAIRVHGRVLRFQRIGQLLPGAEARWNIVVRAEHPSEEQLEVSMTSDAMRLRLPTRPSAPPPDRGESTGIRSGSNPPHSFSRGARSPL